MDYDKLVTFLKVCEAGGFTRAAQRLLRSQSAVSQQIKSLEQELGLVLLLRKKAGIQLTHQGAALYRALQGGISQIDDCMAHLTDASSTIAASVRVGVIADYGSERMVNVVEKLRSDYPNVDFQFVFHNTSREVEAALEKDELDFGIVVFIKKPKIYRIVQLATIKNVLAASPAYLSKTRIKTAFELVEAHLIDFTLDFTAIGYWIRLYAPKALKALRTKKPVAIVPNQYAVRDLIKAGIGVGVLQPRLFAKEFETGELVEVLPQRGRPFMVGIHLVYKRDRKLRNFEEKIVSILCEQR